MEQINKKFVSVSCGRLPGRSADRGQADGCRLSGCLVVQMISGWNTNSLQTALGLFNSLTLTFLKSKLFSQLAFSWLGIYKTTLYVVQILTIHINNS